MAIQPTIRVVRRWRGIDWSVSCLMFATMTFFMGIAAFNTQANLLYAVFGLMMGVLIFSFILSGAMVRRLAIRRDLPDGASVGRAAVITYTLTNAKRILPSLSVSLAEVELPGMLAFRDPPVAYFLHVAGGQSAAAAIEVMPVKRGVHAMGWLQYCTNFPFGYFRIAALARAEQTFVVHPAIAKVDAAILKLLRPADMVGLAIRPRRGGSEEFYGLTEYRQGDNPRLIYWKRSAKTGTLVLREMSRVSPPRIIIALDTLITPGEASSPPERVELLLERAISMAASVCSFAIEHDLQVGLIAANGDDRGGITVIPVSLGKRHRKDILNLLASLRRNTSVGPDALVARAGELMEAQATIVLISAFAVSGSPPEPVSDGVAPPTRSRGGGGGRGPATRSKVVLLSAQADHTLDLFDFPAAAGLRHKRSPPAADGT